jgi:hypothetical protein
LQSPLERDEREIMFAAFLVQQHERFERLEQSDRVRPSDRSDFLNLLDEPLRGVR